MEYIIFILLLFMVFALCTLAIVIPRQLRIVSEKLETTNKLLDIVITVLKDK